MKFLKGTLALVVMMIQQPTFIYANSMDASDSSLPYCNRTIDHPETRINEVCITLFDGLNEIDDLCSQDELVG